MITPNTTVSRKEEIVVAELDGKTVMMSLENGQYYGLDGIATSIWEGIKNSITVEELVSILTAEYSTTKENCQKDVLEFLENIYSKQLINIS